MVFSWGGRGRRRGEVGAHLAEVYGTEVSKQTITAITDRVMEGLADWQSRPLDPVYAVIFIDAINVKIREGQVPTRPIYRPLGDVGMLVCDGVKGLPDAVSAVWEKTIVQTCIVHLLRNSFKYASKRDWAAVAKDLKPVYTAA